MICGRMLIAALGNHSIAITQAGVARSAINIEALTAAGKIFCVDRDLGRHIVARIRADLSGVEICVFVKLAPGNGAIHWRTR